MIIKQVFRLPGKEGLGVWGCGRFFLCVRCFLILLLLLLLLSLLLVLLLLSLLSLLLSLLLSRIF